MDNERKAFDYVVVGAGSAGCVVAARLSEDPNVSVALLEAGAEDSRPEAHIPALWPLLLKSSYDWDLLSEPEPALNNRRLYLPRGKMLGGCSSINAMIYLRGNPADYDGWAAGGATGWTYDDVLPYFRRAEDNERGENDYHGVGGPLGVSDTRSGNPLVAALIESAKLAGHEANPDFNGPRQEGVGWFQLTQKGGYRASTSEGYLRPVLGRPNLTVITHAMANRILFEGNRAVGVEITRNDAVQEIRAEQEVVLSAGAYQSPVLLMLSGIGPEDELSMWGIEMRENLPVGHNLQDHPMAVLNWLSDGGSLFDAFVPENFEQFERDQTGPLTSNIPEGNMFVRTRAGLEAPDLQIHLSGSLLADEGLSAPAGHGFCMGPVVSKPNSRGRVTLRATVPDAKPRVVSNLLVDDDDMRTMIEGVKIALEISKQDPISKRTTGGYQVPASSSEEDIVSWLRQTTQLVYHPTSSCAIGSVVDPELRVYGFEGLRVVDASVMPSITRGNTNGPTIMIGEKGADLIRQSAGSQAVAGVA